MAPDVGHRNIHAAALPFETGEPPSTPRRHQHRVRCGMDTGANRDATSPAGNAIAGERDAQRLDHVVQAGTAPSSHPERIIVVDRRR
jgi:hypothetical protein